MGRPEIDKTLEELKRERDKLDAKIQKLQEFQALDAGTVQGKKRKSTLEMAEEVLESKGKPMHTKDIAEAIQTKFDSFVKTTSLGTMLYRCAVNRKKTFRKEESDNTYSLLKWQAR
jgi:transposase